MPLLVSADRDGRDFMVIHMSSLCEPQNPIRHSEYQKLEKISGRWSASCSLGWSTTKKEKKKKVGGVPQPAVRSEEMPVSFKEVQIVEQIFNQPADQLSPLLSSKPYPFP